MVQPSQPNPANNSDITVLESQIRECYGRVVWTHKTHEKCADIYAAKLKALKTTEIILSALTTTSLLTSIFVAQRWGIIIGTLLSTLLLGVTIYAKDYDLGKIAKSHADTAVKMWSIRESYLSLLTDIKLNNLTLNQIQAKRDELQNQLASVYENAPRTNSKAYDKASQALKSNEEMTFSDEEIDKFLPNDIRRKQSQP